MALASNPFHKVLMLPGQYDSREGLIHGPDTIEALQRYRAGKAFLGASGLTAEGPSDAGVGPGLIYGAMMRRSTRNGRAGGPHQVRPRRRSRSMAPGRRRCCWSATQEPAGELRAALERAGARTLVC